MCSPKAAACRPEGDNGVGGVRTSFVVHSLSFVVVVEHQSWSWEGHGFVLKLGRTLDCERKKRCTEKTKVIVLAVAAAVHMHRLR